jgi:hypothetical protein
MGQKRPSANVKLVTRIRNGSAPSKEVTTVGKAIVDISVGQHLNVTRWSAGTDSDEDHRPQDGLNVPALQDR